MKTETKALDQSNEASNRWPIKRRAQLWGIIPRPPGCTLPTTEQLSHLVAQLAHGALIDDGRRLCADALALWHTANEALDIQRKASEEGQLERAAMADCKARHPDPARSDFPMNLDTFLRWQWPEKDTAERSELFKLRLGDVIRNEGEQPTQEAIERRYIEAQKEVIDRTRFYRMQDALTRWHKQHRAESVSQVRRAAGAAGGKTKRKARPPVISRAEMEALTHSAEK